jgi:hypothetical protein
MDFLLNGILGPMEVVPIVKIPACLSSILSIQTSFMIHHGKVMMNDLQLSRLVERFAESILAYL